MQSGLQIAFRNMESSASAEEQIQARVADLERTYDRITAYRVMVESAHRHHHQGKLFHIRVDLIVPGREIVVKRDPPEHHAHEDLHVAIRDAFDAVHRQLEDHVREGRGQLKAHAAHTIGRIVRLFPDHGFLATDTGDEIYLHRNCVAGNGFDRLQVGDRVRYVTAEREAEEGPQASVVFPLERQHPMAAS